MRVISKKKLTDFWKRHPDAEQQLRAWHADAKASKWRTPLEIERVYANARCIRGNRAIFNIKGNKYRLIVKIHYDRGFVYVRFIGTHSEYDNIDATKI